MGIQGKFEPAIVRGGDYIQVIHFYPNLIIFATNF